MTQRELPFPIETWLKLLAKANADGIRLQPMARTKAVMRATGSDGRTTYDVSAERCTCPAGQFGNPCKHRALWVLEHIGEYADAILLASVQLDLKVERMKKGAA